MTDAILVENDLNELHGSIEETREEKKWGILLHDIVVLIQQKDHYLAEKGSDLKTQKEVMMWNNVIRRFDQHITIRSSSTTCSQRVLPIPLDPI